jgi:predicted phosphodiesterase
LRIAALYDIHGNLNALDAVLADIERDPPDLVVVGGDFLLGPSPVACLDRLIALGNRAAYLRGNTDREISHALDREARSTYPWSGRLRWVAEQLSKTWRDWLAALPTALSFDVAGLGPTLFCHGSPRSDEEIMTRLSSETRSLEMFAGVMEPVVVCGHTHIQFDRNVAGRRVVNAGSVGLPYEAAPGAYWAVFGPTVTLRRTEYDLQSAVASIRASGFPDAEAFLETTLLGCHVPDDVAALFERRTEEVQKSSGARGD